MPGKTWTAQEEAELKALVGANANVDEIAVKLQKTPKSVITKSLRLGLGLKTEGYVSDSIRIPRELPSIEETLKMLAGALKASVKPGLNRLEVQRLQLVANLSQTYKDLAVDYAHYRDVEIKLEKNGGRECAATTDAPRNQGQRPERIAPTSFKLNGVGLNRSITISNKKSRTRLSN